MSTGLRSHRYPYGPSAEYLEERVCSGDIERRQKKKRIGEREQLSCDREAKLIGRNRESYVKSRKRELLINILLSKTSSISLAPYT